MATRVLTGGAMSHPLQAGGTMTGEDRKEKPKNTYPPIGTSKTLGGDL